MSAKQPEFETPAQASRRNLGRWGVTGRGAEIIIIIDDPLKPEEALSQSNAWLGLFYNASAFLAAVVAASIGLGLRRMQPVRA